MEEKFAEQTLETEAASEAPPTPYLEDGIGLTFEDVKLAIAMKHDATISQDDPVLMLVTVCNAFLTEQEKLLERHNKAVTKIMASQTGDYITQVKDVACALGQTLSDSSVDGIRKVFADNALL